jgi:hypothetical protein
VLRPALHRRLLALRKVEAPRRAAQRARTLRRSSRTLQRSSRLVGCGNIEARCKLRVVRDHPATSAPGLGSPLPRNNRESSSSS